MRRTQQVPVPRAGAAGVTSMVVSRPSSSSSRVASRDCSETPRPARAPCLMAPLEPSVSTRGLRPWAARISSVSVRVPEPSSRSSQGRAASSSIGTERRHASGSAGLGDHHHRVIEKALAQDALTRWAPADRHIGAMHADPLEHPLAVAHLEVQLDLRVQPREGLDQRRARCALRQWSPPPAAVRRTPRRPPRGRPARPGRAGRSRPPRRARTRDPRRWAGCCAPHARSARRRARATVRTRRPRPRAG